MIWSSKVIPISSTVTSNLSTQVAEALKQGRTTIGVSLLKGLNISFFPHSSSKDVHGFQVLRAQRMDCVSHKDASNFQGRTKARVEAVPSHDKD